MKIFYLLLFIGFVHVVQAQEDSSKNKPYLTRITMDVTDVQDPLLFASSIDISLKSARNKTKYATQILLGSMDIGDVRTLQFDLLEKNTVYADISSSLIQFNFKSRSVDDFIGVFNFIFEFSDGSNYPYRLGKINIGNNLRLSIISRTIYIR